MLIENIRKSSGQIAKTLLALAILVLVALVIAYIVVSYAKPRPEPTPGPDPEPLPMYETTIGDIRFVFLEATDEGGTLYGSDSNFPDWQKDLTTTERFIMLTVGAQNVGKVNTEQNIWKIMDIVDSEGRNYTPSTEEVRGWLPREDLCGEVLKPSFEPTPCIKYYEVAKVATGLKVRVALLKNPGGGDAEAEGLIDIKLMP